MNLKSHRPLNNGIVHYLHHIAGLLYHWNCYRRVPVHCKWWL